MSISPDLFMAVLAMDAYNRGYNAGIINLGDLGARIGNAIVLADSRSLQDTQGNRLDQPAGLYAIAYDVGAVTGFSTGEKLISYRGTDSATDILTGWKIGAGDYFATHGALAAQFFSGGRRQWQH